MKQKFQLDAGTRLHITSTSIRREKHGDSKVPAFDLGCRWETSNDSLALFDSRLKGAFFQKAKTPAEPPPQSELDLPVSDLPSLRFPDLGAQSWERELHDYVLTLTTTTGEEIVLRECTAKKFAFDCIEGGSVIITFQVQVADVGAHVIGALGVLLDNDVEASLTPPVDGEQGSVLGEVKPLGDGQVVAIASSKKGKSADSLPPGSPEAALVATQDTTKVKLSPDAAWPFPKKDGEPAGLST